MKPLIALAATILAACSTTVIEDREVDGIPYVMVIDGPDSECGRLKFNEGCTYIPKSGTPRVYVSSIAPQWVIDHELEHVRGMVHTPWRDTPRGVCAFVLFGGTGKKYARGDTLCNVGGVEIIYKPT